MSHEFSWHRPEISITILSYRNPAMLRMCLRAIAEHLPRGIVSETIVVDNATSPETQNVVREEFGDKIPNLRIIPIIKNAGYTRGVNEGLRAARGEYILSLNYDIVLQPGAIERLLEYHRAHPNVGMVGPELLNFNGTRQDSCFRFYTPFTVLFRRLPFLPGGKRIIGSFLMRDADYTQAFVPDWISGAAMMVSRRGLEQVGFLDERFFHYFSDVDWCRRFWENDMAVAYYPGVQLYHYHGQSSRGGFPLIDLILRRESRWHLADGVKYFLKYGTRKTLIQRNNISEPSPHAYP